jgi:predicted DNA-binding transcriptional regulator AlpA
MNQSEVCKLLSVSRQTVTAWQKEKPPIPFERIGSAVVFDAPEVVAWFAAREVSKALLSNAYVSDERKAAECRDAMARAELREIELARVKGELLPAGEVQREWTGLVIITRNAMLNLAHPLAIIEDGLTYAVKKEKILRQIENVLRVLGSSGKSAPCGLPTPPKALKQRHVPYKAKPSEVKQ